MKEVKSLSEWVGKTLTCKTCNRSFEVEAGDEILRGWTSQSRKHHISVPRRFNLPCGHYHAV